MAASSALVAGDGAAHADVQDNKTTERPSARGKNIFTDPDLSKPWAGREAAAHPTSKFAPLMQFPRN